MGLPKGRKKKLSERRMVENEVIFREVNKDVKEFIKTTKFIDPAKPIYFYCECANPECVEKIKLTTMQYEKLHKKKQLFVTIPGHEFPEVETVVSKSRNFQVVEKHDPPPSPEKIDLTLKSIKI